MYFPKINYTGRPMEREFLNSRGINYSDNLTDGDLAESKNLASIRWPYLTARNRRVQQDGYKGVTALYWWDGLITVSGTDLFWRGKKVGTVAAGAKAFAAINTKLVIWPDKIMLDSSGVLTPLEVKVTATKAVVTPDEITFTGAPDLTGVFKVGDNVKFSGFKTLTENNRDFVIKALTPDKITTSAKTMKEGTEEAEITIERRVPDLDYICESGNRLWGCSNRDKTIYASSLGDPSNFYVYEGISSDSYAVPVGSQGDFTGICQLSGTVLVWKEQTLHKVLGNYPAEYTVIDYDLDGLRAGCHKSLVIINDILYYVGLHGVFRYTGATPYPVASQLGQHQLTDAVGGSDGDRLYLSALDDGVRKLYTYDPKIDVWLQEDELDCVDFARSGLNLYTATKEGEVWSLDSHTTDPSVEWMARFTPFYEAIQGRKRYKRVTVRIECPEKAWAQVYVRYDGGLWDLLGDIVGKDIDAVPFHINPNRCDKFEIMIKGKGPCALKSVCREFEIGGDGG